MAAIELIWSKIHSKVWITTLLIVVQTCFLDIDCSDLQESMNGPLFHSGCPGAVHVDGSPSKRYCEGTGYDEKIYPWWKQCCIWDGTKCQRKAGKY